MAGAWSVALALLGLAWVRSQAVGMGLALSLWTVAEAPLLLVSWPALRRTLPELPRVWPLLLVLLAQAGGLVLVWRQLGPEIAMDGIVMRDAGLLRWGTIVTWMPFSLAGLTALGLLVLSLEARYRERHGPRADDGG